MCTFKPIKMVMFCFLLYFFFVPLFLCQINDNPIQKKYTPQIFDPLKDFYFYQEIKNENNKILKQMNEITEQIDSFNVKIKPSDNQLNVNLKPTPTNQLIVSLFHELTSNLNELIRNILSSLREIIKEMNQIYHQEEDLPTLLSNLYDEVIQKVEQIVEYGLIYQERIVTLVQLSENQFKLKGLKLRDAITSYLMAFQEESNEFINQADVIINSLIHLKEENSEVFYSFESESELESEFENKGKTINSIEDSSLEFGLEGLEDLKIEVHEL